MELKEAIYGRRSVRKYTERQISDEDLHEILDAACWAPSAVNLQHWYFVACRSEEALSKLQEIMGGSIFGLTKTLQNRFQNHPQVIEETLDFVKSMGGARTVILAFLQNPHYEESTAAIESTAAAIQNMILTAYSKGIASCWLTAPLLVGEELRETFAPEHGQLVAAVTMGYSDLEPKAPRRKEGRYIIC